MTEQERAQWEGLTVKPGELVEKLAQAMWTSGQAFAGKVRRLFEARCVAETWHEQRQAEWLEKHARLPGLSVVEVYRLLPALPAEDLVTWVAAAAAEATPAA